MITDSQVRSLILVLKDQGGVIRVDYSRHNQHNLEIIGEAERRGLVKTRVIDHHEAQWSELEVSLSQGETI